MTEQFKSLVTELMESRFVGKDGTCNTDDNLKLGVQSMDPFPETEAKDPSAIRTLPYPEHIEYEIKLLDAPVI